MPVRRRIPKPRVGIWREIQAHVAGPEPREHAAVVNVLRIRIRQTEAEAFGTRLPHVRCCHNHAHKRVCIKRARSPALRSCAAVRFCTLVLALLVQKHKY